MGTTNTKQLVDSVRELTHEYQSEPITDEYIIKRLNEAYTYVYNHYVKSNDEMFGEVHWLTVSAGVTTYQLPENLFNKRVETLLIPTPPNESQTPWGYAKVRKAQYKQSYQVQTTRIRTYYPELWCTLGNNLYIFPPPLIGYRAQLIVSRKIPKLAIHGGVISELGNNEIVLDELNDSRIEDGVGYDNKAFISVCDKDTGELKALFSYSAVNTTTNTITLQASPRKYATYTIQDLTYTAVEEGTDGQEISVTYVGGLLTPTATVTVSGNAITVQIQSGATDATTIRAAIIASAEASNLVWCSITGTGSDAQTTSAQVYLIGGENIYDNQEISDLPGTQWGDIQVDDIVCYGHGASASIFGEAFDAFLVDWAVMRLRGALNETDPETMNALKLHLTELTGDLGGRPLGIKINMTERNFFGSKSYRRTR